MSMPFTVSLVAGVRRTVYYSNMATIVWVRNTGPADHRLDVSIFDKSGEFIGTETLPAHTEITVRAHKVVVTPTPRDAPEGQVVLATCFIQTR